MRYCHIALLLALLCSAGCGEGAANRATRVALASACQKHFSVGRDYAMWVQAKATRSDTWQDAFDKLDSSIKAQDAIATELQGVVLTERYKRLGGVLNRAIAAQGEYLRARKNMLTQTFQASLASGQQSESQNNQASATSYYEKLAYWKSATNSFKQSQEAMRQAESFRVSSVAIATRSVSQSDTLRALIVRARLLPDPGPLTAPIATTESESLLVGAGSPIVLTR